MSLLAIDNLTKNFGGVQAVNRVSFTVEPGEILGLIGPNGAGKTTCFNLINGLIPPTAGSIRMSGRELVGLPPYRRAARGLGRTFQNIQLFGGMTVLDNVLTGNHLGQEVGIFEALLPLPKVKRAQARATERALELLQLVGLAGKGDLPAESLAYGEQRRLEIGRALALGPQLLLLDEPAAGLNPRETEDLMGLMEELRRLGHHPAGHRTRHDPGHGPLRPHRGPGPRRSHRRRPAPGDSEGSPGHRGVFGPGGRVSSEQLAVSRERSHCFLIWA